MARTDDDSWDLASSVGATATMVAAARAAATRKAIIDDPFAEPLVRAVGVDFFTRVAAGEADLDAATGIAPFARMIDMFAARTRFFDDFFLDAAQAGIRQVVIVAAGLDSRAYRLAWPTDLTVYEIDQPEVIEFKTRTLADLGATPTAQLRTVGIDLRRDWPTALRQAGFQPDQPTAWNAEGILIGFLPPDAQDQLLGHIAELSAPASRFAADYTTQELPFDQHQTHTVTQRWREQGVDIDAADLAFTGKRTSVADYLHHRGWDTAEATTSDLITTAGLPPLQDNELHGPSSTFSYLTATRK